MLRRSEEADVISAWNTHPETISWVASEGYDDIHHYGGGGGAGLGFASAGLCTLFAFTSLSSFPSALLEQNLSQPTQDVGGESRLGKYRGLC